MLLNSIHGHLNPVKRKLWHLREFIPRWVSYSSCGIFTIFPSRYFIEAISA